MQGALITILLYQQLAEQSGGVDDFLLEDGQDFLLEDFSNFLLQF